MRRLQLSKGRCTGGHRRKIDRVYLYQWFASPPTNRWDSAVLDIHGAPRPVFDVLLANRTLFR